MRTLLPRRGERWLFLAPHPDDEALAAGGLLARARAAGARVRVLFLTDGDNAPWIQRVHERRWRIGPEDRRRFGALRRGEALGSLAELGIEASEARFLGALDQSITPALEEGGAALLAALTSELSEFRPDVVLGPSLSDLHPDHSAAALLLRCALGRLAPRPRALEYVVHTRRPPRGCAGTLELVLTPEERARKRRAIERYASQLSVHRRKFLALVDRPERLFEPAALELHAERGASGPREPHPVCNVARDGRRLELDLAPCSSLGAFGRCTLWIARLDAGERLDTFALELAGPPVERVLGERALGPHLSARVERVRGRCRVHLELEELPASGSLFLKVERRFGFFDEAGWLELDLRGRGAGAPAAAAERPFVCAVVPCYDVARLCGPVVRQSAAQADLVIAVDDGSTDGTGEVLRALASELPGRVEVLSFPENRGKGVALIEGFRRALAACPCDVLVTLDGDGQHAPADIQRLARACRDADLAVGVRSFEQMPPRSRLGNGLTSSILRRFAPSCPVDTQSGLRAFRRAFVEDVVQRVRGWRYETELRMLLLALAQRRTIASVPIATVYLPGNRSSHFRVLSDSLCIYGVLLRHAPAVLLEERLRRHGF